MKFLAPRGSAAKPLRLLKKNTQSPLILAVETSCDETAAALIAGRRVLASEVSSQIPDHRPWGGVVPEIASRNHIRLLQPVVVRALQSAGVTLQDLHAVAATRGPGLSGALIAGFVFAKTLAIGLGRPFLAVNHMEGHLVSPFFETGILPSVVLIASGGHTLLVDYPGFGQHKVLETTRDDAAGEAFDKAARLLGLPYPGGPEIDQLAQKGDPFRFAFPRPMLRETGFSFSGLKTAVRILAPSLKPGDIPDVCASFQEAVVDVLVEKTLTAALRCGRSRVAVAGGVGCNRRLREKLAAAAAQNGLEMLAVPPWLATDNAAMIAFAASERLANCPPGAPPDDLDLDVAPNLKL